MQATLTTAELQQFALDQLARVRKTADAWHALAMAKPGDRSGSTYASMLDVERRYSGSFLSIAAACSYFGDAAGSEAIHAACSELSSRMIEQSSDARMVGVPGWDPITRSFPKVAA